MAPHRSKKYSAYSNSARNARHRRARDGRQYQSQMTRTRPRRQPQPPVPVEDGERKAMFTSMMYFINNDTEKENELLRMLQSTQPAIWHKILRQEKVEVGDLTDDAVRGISQVIYQRKTGADVDIQVPQKELTRGMAEFNDRHIRQLAPFRFQQLQSLIKASVPSLNRFDDDEAAALPPSCLSTAVQIMVFKYLNQHLPEDIKADIQRGEAADEMDVAGEEETYEAEMELVEDEDLEIIVDLD